MTSPVTQVAEVAVNSASRKPMLRPLLDAAGSVSRQAPVNIIKAKLDTMILVGEIVFSRFFFRCAMRIYNPLVQK
jgi:hypothetical protein